MHQRAEDRNVHNVSAFTSAHFFWIIGSVALVTLRHAFTLERSKLHEFRSKLETAKG